jgi:serine/threonine-protein kinase
VRKPLGKLLSRKLDSAVLQSSTSGVGMPKGTFVIAQFNTSFENMKSARETVTFQKEADGAWRAAGYFIKPD